jgi:caffeoyl-CoA O-methyltransferase
MLSVKFVLPVAGTAVILLAIIALAQRRGNQSSSLPSPRTDTEKKIIDTLADVMRKRETYLNVPIEDGKALRLLAEAAGAKNIVEVGTSTGYSGLWFCLALQSTGGHLTTFELDHGRAAMARSHFDQAGVGGLVTIVEGDAHQNLKRLHDPIDVAFIDAEKDGYVDYLNQILPLVRPGGLILAHNIGMAPDYVRAVTSNPALETIFYREGAGLGITLKKR